MKYHNLCVGLLLIVTGCIFYDGKPVQQPVPEKKEILKSAAPPLVIIGEGGTSGYLFQYAADTYVKENGGEKYTVHDGDEFVRVMRDFYNEHGPITSFVYFGHGNDVGLYVNQAPHINGGLYVNDPQLDAPFRAASIYELPRKLFGTGSTALFYGCNVAREFEGQDSFAEQFANHFHTTVSASTGPTEFSFQKDTPTGNMPARLGNESLYMIPTFSQQGFVTIKPSKELKQYDDVHESMEAAAAIGALTKRGLSFGSGTISFHPEQSISVSDARLFCKMIDATAPCAIEGMQENELYRNTSMLKLLIDAAKFPVKTSTTPFEGEIYFANQHALLTHDFIHKRWYSRADTAMLTWNILQLKESGVSPKKEL